MVDGDTVFEPETLRRLVQPLADPAVGAVSGNTKVGNRGGLLGRWQHIEYVIGFNLDRRMYEVLQCTPTVPGAIGAFRRDVLVEVGGVPERHARRGHRPDAGHRPHRTAGSSTRRTRAPGPRRRRRFGGLWRQRYRWSYGTMQAVWKHKGAMLSARPRDAASAAAPCRT